MNQADGKNKWVNPNVQKFGEKGAKKTACTMFGAECGESVIRYGPDCGIRTGNKCRLQLGYSCKDRNSFPCKELGEDGIDGSTIDPSTGSGTPQSE